MWKLGFLYSVLLLMTGQFFYCHASIPVCLTNCMQCKQMYGRYFHGGACGNACISTNGRTVPDCDNPGTLGNYLLLLANEVSV